MVTLKKKDCIYIYIYRNKRINNMLMTCYRQMWQVSCRKQGMLTQGPAPDPKSKV